MKYISVGYIRNFLPSSMGYYTTQNRKGYSLDPPPGLRPSKGNALTFVQSSAPIDRRRTFFPCPPRSARDGRFDRFLSIHLRPKHNRSAFDDVLSANTVPFTPSSTERAMQLLRSELQPPSAWRRRPSDWRLRLRPCGCWLVRHTTVGGQG